MSASTTAERILCARIALSEYALRLAKVNEVNERPVAVATDLIADLLHYVQLEGESAETALLHAYANFRSGPKEADT